MTSFAELGLSENILQAISELGYENPMPVQEQVIPYILEGDHDLVALAQTGTGKTAAFGLPLLHKLSGVAGSRKPEALVLCPTRELCIQIAEDLKDYAKYIPGFNVMPVYGGASIKNQLDGLKRGVRVVVATPGRLLDLMERGAADLSEIRTVVMDEADEMLNMGFQEDIDSILEAVPEGRSTMLFSATMPAEIERIAKKYMRDPHEIVIGRKNESTSSVRHICYTVKASDKYQTLKRIVDFYPRIYGIIFCRTKTETQQIADNLIHDGYNADSLHGDLSQAQRDYVMRRFRLHNIQLLVATDVAARGIDVDDLTHIINYSLPDEDEIYTHRSGRTGRAGKTGISIAIINSREGKRIRQIEKTIGKTFEIGKIPSGKEICTKQIFSLVDRIEKVDVDEEEIADLLPSVFSKLEWLDKEDLVKRIVSLEFNRMIGYYKDNEDFDAEDLKGKKFDVPLAEGYRKIFVSIGKMDGMGPKQLLGVINRCMETAETKIAVGRIDIFTRYSLIDVAEESAESVIGQLCTLHIKGRPVRAALATEEQVSRGTKSVTSERQSGRQDSGRRKDRKPRDRRK